MIVAVDGPAGSGKSSVCAQVCEKIGWTYVNTGFLYRGVAYLALQRGTDLETDKQLIAVVQDFIDSYSWDPEAGRLTLAGSDVTDELTAEAVGRGASKLAKSQKVRELLLPVQRQLGLACRAGAIVDGRDIGTVVFPDAPLKIFLTASLEERARRRAAQLKGAEVDIETLQAQIKQRDQQDAARAVAPLRCADDAVVLDTSAMGVETVVDEMIEILRQKSLI